MMILILCLGLCLTSKAVDIRRLIRLVSKYRYRDRRHIDRWMDDGGGGGGGERGLAIHIPLRRKGRLYFISFH